MKTKILFFTLSLVLMLFSPFSFSLDLASAKSQGLVGEQTDGYLGSPKGNKASAKVTSLISDINKKRKDKYRQIAKKVNKSLDVVEQLAGEKAQSKTKSGHYIRTASGRWVKR